VTKVELEELHRLIDEAVEEGIRIVTEKGATGDVNVVISSNKGEIGVQFSKGVITQLSVNEVADLAATVSKRFV